MIKRKVVPVLAALTVLAAVAGPVHAQETELNYTITEARATAYKISVTKEAIQAAGLAPCDEETDPYQCDSYRYEQEPNCPANIAIGRSGPLPQSGGPPGAGTVSGAAGEGSGRVPSNKEPPGASPVKINEVMSVGRLSKAGAVLEAGGVGSDTFVDLDGRAVPTAHTESDAFVENRNAYEERCDPNTGASYAHVMSRAAQTPEVFSMAECFDQRCFQSGSTEGRPAARHARTTVHLYESGGKVYGRLRAFVTDLVAGSGPQSLGVQNMSTVLNFETDGTPKGLRWSASSTASGVTIGGQAASLPPGETVELPTGNVPCPEPPPIPPVPGAPSVPNPCVGPTFVGLAGPYVITNAEGTLLTMIAPGMFYGNNQQTTYVGGAEVRAGFGRAAPFSFSPFGGTGDGFSLGLIRPGPAPFGTEIPPAGGGLPAVEAAAPADPRTVSLQRLPAGPVAAASILGFGGLIFLVLLAGWIKRFEWGKRIYRAQPLRSLNWIYRAFVRT